MKYSAEIWFPEGVYIPSLNYIYRPKRGKKGIYLYKDERVAKFQGEFIHLGNETELIKLRDRSPPAIELSLIFLIKSRFDRRDVSNMIKAVEDGLVSIINIDDRFVHIIHASKEKQTKKREGLRIEINELYT